MSLAEELLNNILEDQSSLVNILTWDGTTSDSERLPGTNLWRVSSQAISVEDIVGTELKWSDETTRTITIDDIDDLRSVDIEVDDEGDGTISGEPMYKISSNLSGRTEVHIAVVTESYIGTSLIKQGIYLLKDNTGWVESLTSKIDIFDPGMSDSNVDAEPHIVIGKDRYIIVPDELKRIAVQYDHDIETVTFDCPRYWDEHDLSKMAIYVNFMRPDAYKDSCPVDNICVDSSDDTIIHFQWTVSGNVTLVSGQLSFLVCAKVTDEDGNEKNHWNSELNQDMYVSQGLECQESILLKYPDIITKMLLRINAINVSEFVMIDDGKGNVEIKGIGLSRAIGEEYSNEKTYEPGDYAMYYGGLYKCITKVSTPEDWDAEKWQTVIITDELNKAMEELKVYIEQRDEIEGEVETLKEMIPYKVIIDDTKGTIDFIDRDSV